MKQYIELLKDVMQNGIDKPDRTSVGNSRAVFGRQLRFDLSEGFPILTTRKVPLRIAFEETMFFLRGETNTKLLEEKQINIWKGNTSREFLDSRGLFDTPVGDMGKGYGYQWRHWETIKEHKLWSHANEEMVSKYKKGPEVDQIKNLLEGLETDPYGRRHIVTGWNPGQLNDMALPPCHMMHMYSVANGKLNSSFVMRSNDVPFGLPFNIMSYALLNHIFAKYLELIPGELVYMGWDVHIYANQFKMVEEQLKRDVRPLPHLKIDTPFVTFDDIMELKWTDIQLLGYDPHPDIADKPEMAV